MLYKMAYHRNVFITGCNRGLGLEFVKQFLSLPKPPCHLFATCRSVQQDNSQELRNLAQEHSNLHVLQLDVTNEDEITNVASEIGKVLREEGLNLIINNAGATASVTVDNVTADQMLQTFQINTVGPLMIIKALLPFLKRAAATKDQNPNSTSNSTKIAIVNISAKTASIADNTSGKLYPSRASKAALNIITKSLSVDLKPNGIMAIVMNPGWVKTPNGGPNALITPQESVSGMMKVIASLDQSKTGMFFNYTGETISW